MCGAKAISMDPRVIELHCIMPLRNVPSVLQHGILSHDAASRLPHQSVAMQEVQDRRDQKGVPGGLRLHQYANLYFHARNPMLSRRRTEDVCVLRVSNLVLNLPGAVITDQNAASNYVRFLSPGQWQTLDFDDIYARDWRHPGNQIEEWRHKSRKCAEVLIPRMVQPQMLVGALVPDDRAAGLMTDAGFPHHIVIDPDFFFR